ncbi:MULTISPECIES: inosine/xanthosine triphosphatase [Cyclobacterium]|uniref:Probable inosine/xanthosine triphosphatase n=1 Tax=Cyclobacterium plantarum TaxID=2716263 RepID=A0ABX0HC58_9BACT|nr:MULTISPECIES: inosine/xanthosine triphosphatase [Cyclobacterium]MBD3629577.1 inosine/xanthosine triphosphatase [Cyclobacterium sp.]NHE59466.1 non-canonical purine NTP phosphatase [Cyclobacterium plantarum]
MAFPKRRNLQDQKRQKLVIVGSKNPVKIKCTENAFQSIFEDYFIVQGLNADPNVSAQPMGDVETYTGAYNRAYESKKAFPEADFWVGIEGGVDEVGEQMVAFAWMVVMDGSNKIGKAKTATFFLPEALSKLIREGMELGEADDQVFKRTNSKQNNGAVGILTNGIVNRMEYYQQAVTLALIPFVNKSIY